MIPVMRMQGSQKILLQINCEKNAPKKHSQQMIDVDLSLEMMQAQAS